MPDLKPVFDELQLSESARAAEINWTEIKSKESLVLLEKIHEIYINVFKEAKEVNLHNELPLDMYLEFLHCRVADLMRPLVPDKPGEKIEFLVIGPYPGTVWNNIPSCKILGFVKLPNGTISPALITASKENFAKVANMELFEVYNLEVVPGKNNSNNKVYIAYLHKNADFIPANIITSPTWIGATKDDRIKTVINSCPATVLAQANLNTSQTLNFKRKNEGELSYINKADIKLIQVGISDFQTGKYEDGREWGQYIVHDSSLTPTPERKGFIVWIDPDLVRKLGVGPGSFVRILGTIEFDREQKYPQMTACSVIPIRKVPPLTAPNLSGFKNPYKGNEGPINMAL
jgi:hypothetical protein